MFDADTVLRDRVHDAIRSNPYLTGRPLHWETSQGRVVLRGVVGTYYQKQMAQEAVRRIDGVEAIDNRLEVTWS